MKLAGITAAIAAAAAATNASAQDAAQATATAAAPAEVAAAAEGVIAYPPEFFASAQPQSAMDMIERVPGFQFSGGDSVRGFAGAAGNVLIDGQRPASKSDPLEALLRRIPATTVERIELIRGGATGIDMQGQTVLVNVVRKTEASQQALWAIASGIYADGRTSPAMRLEGSRRWDGRFAEGSILYYNFVDDGAGEGPRRVFDPTGTLIERANADETAGGQGIDTKASFETPLLGGKFRINAAAKFEEYAWELDDETTFPAPFQFHVEDDFDLNFQGEAGVQWSRPLGPRTTLELLALQTWRDSDFTSTYEDAFDELIFTQGSVTGESIVRGKMRWAKSDTFQIEYGAEAAYNFLDRATGFVLNGAPVPLPAASVLVEESRAEAFATITWRPFSTLTVEAGSKIEYSMITQSGDTDLEESFVYPKPRLFVTWAPNETNQFRFRIEREVGQLNFGDFVSSAQLSTGVITGGNADLRPYQAWTYEAAYERRFWEKGALILTAQHSQIEDVVDRIPVIDLSTCPLVAGIPDPTSPLCVFFSGVGNIDQGESTQFSVNLTLPLDRLMVKGGLLNFNGTWRQSEVVDPTTGESRRISGQSPFNGEVTFSQDIPAWRVNWGADAFLGFRERYYGIDQIEQIELQTWFRLWAEWKAQPKLSIRIELQNLAARDFIRDRDVYAGLRDNTPLVFREERNLNFDPFFYFRIRKTWG